DARTRVIPILSHDEAPVRHCAKAGYESVVTVPIRMQQRLLGEFNLFFRTPILLSADEIELLDALASHLASSLEGLRADALDREAAVAEERALLARNLHDSIAQSLAFLKIQVHLLRTAVQKGQAPQVQGALDELDIGLRESIGDVRELLVHFRTRTNTDDIGQALQETLQKFQSQTGLSGQLQVQGEGLPLPSDVQVQVLHVIQEALSNVRKHAGATQVGLEIHKGERWRFVVRDNGAGFDTGKHPGPSHVGLNIMRERAGRLGAEVGIVSRAGQGTTVTLILPPHPEVSSSATRAAAVTPVAAGVYGS
ncbi:MAG: histidine kinase, partial [Polaromonas sp.]|nr:histidine kinase [Polaromonas sp.]